MSLPSLTHYDLPKDLTGEHDSVARSIVAESPGMRRAVAAARRLAPLGVPILLVGATGTGKEVLAQAIHRWSGLRGNLVDINCGALPAGMAVAELFGHRRGAFTTAIDSTRGLIEDANQGTLFLDELASLPPDGQASLLRMLETGEFRRIGEAKKTRVEVRLIATVPDTVVQLRYDGRLREDLYQRLATGIIHLPRLRDRQEDLLPLARHFALQESKLVADSIIGLLEQYSWPGNVRELRNVIVRAAALSDSRTLAAESIAEALDAGPRIAGSSDQGHAIRSGHGLPEEIRELADLCRVHHGKSEAIAAVLGISRSTLYRKLRRLGLSMVVLAGPRLVRLSQNRMRRKETE